MAPVKRGGTVWPETVGEARTVQRLLKRRLRLLPLKGKPRFIASVDAAFLADKVIAAACLFSYPELEKLDEKTAVRPCAFPYVPGFLSFREGPAVMEAIDKLKVRPDLVIFDGQGIAHPEGFGLASHIGVLLGIPSIGCAKSRLVGEHREPGVKRGMRSPLVFKGKEVGAVLRTRDGVRPLFVSPGHRIDIEGAIGIVLGCSTKYRLPEPQRCADMAAGRAKRMLI